MYLIAAAVSVTAVLAVAGPAYATSNWSCGEVFVTSPAPLDNNLNCTGYGDNALVIGGADVVLNLGGHTVTGDSDWDVVYNDPGYDGLTVENGTLDVGGDGVGVYDKYGDNNTVADVTISGGTYGVDAWAEANGTTVEDSTISSTFVPVARHHGAPKFAPTMLKGIYVSGNDATIEGNTVSPATGGTGIEAVYGLGDVISGNTVTGNFDGTDEIGAEIGIHTHFDTGALVENNTVSSFGYDAAYASWDSGTTYDGNTFENSYEGLEIEGEIGPNSNETISNNFIRNNYYHGVYDYYSDLNSYTGNVLTNNGIECGTNTSDDCAAFYIDGSGGGSGHGSVTMTNNYARLSSYGFWIEDMYSGISYATTRSLFSGNSATYDDNGFADINSVLATWSDNTAYGNNDNGFVFGTPTHETITGNSSTHNGAEGFYFGSNAAPSNPLAVTNNVAEYNGDYGFYAEDPLSASSGNTGSNTNGADDCWYISGCS
ncbi:MAG TPA: right-handed parallel beta-helix repeat-containing protein [Gaiellaceae bacterium]|nr:right-handed parallel beta-helix repeat-containing protein [Gaiellaceae bacterium]